MKLLPISIIMISMVFFQVQRPGTFNIFKSKKAGYVVNYPSDWFEIGSTNELRIHSFPRERSVRGAVIPSDGAGIHILRPSQLPLNILPNNITEWSNMQPQGFREIRRKYLNLTGQKGNISAIEVEQVQTCGEQICMRSISIYFQLGGELFVGDVFFWDGNPKNDRYLEILREIIRSLRLL